MELLDISLKITMLTRLIETRGRLNFKRGSENIKKDTAESVSFFLEFLEF